jgi:hypothetical protein
MRLYIISFLIICAVSLNLAAPQVSKDVSNQSLGDAIKTSSPAFRVKRMAVGAKVGQFVGRLVVTTVLGVAYAGVGIAVNSTSQMLGIGSVYPNGGEIMNFLWRITPIVDQILEVK